MIGLITSGPCWAQRSSCASDHSAQCGRSANTSISTQLSTNVAACRDANKYRALGSRTVTGDPAEALTRVKTP